MGKTTESSNLSLSAKDIMERNRKVYCCSDCGAITIEFEEHWGRWMICQNCHAGLDDDDLFCVLHRKREVKSKIGEYEKCNFCSHRFVCMTSRVSYTLG